MKLLPSLPDRGTKFDAADYHHGVKRKALCSRDLLSVRGGATGNRQALRKKTAAHSDAGQSSLTGGLFITATRRLFDDCHYHPRTMICDLACDCAE